MAAALAMHTALKRMYSVLTLQTIAHRIYTVNERTRVKREGSQDFLRRSCKKCLLAFSFKQTVKVYVSCF